MRRLQGGSAVPLPPSRLWDVNQKEEREVRNGEAGTGWATGQLRDSGKPKRCCFRPECSKLFNVQGKRLRKELTEARRDEGTEGLPERDGFGCAKKRFNRSEYVRMGCILLVRGRPPSLVCLTERCAVARCMSAQSTSGSFK